MSANTQNKLPVATQNAENIAFKKLLKKECNLENRMMFISIHTKYNESHKEARKPKFKRFQSNWTSATQRQEQVLTHLSVMNRVNKFIK